MASKLLGAHVKRKEDPRLITGTSQYVGDVAMPGMQHVAFVRSPYAHARVRGIKAAAALKVPGVVAVVDPFAAMADGAPQLFDDAPKNIEHSTTIKAGDPDAAFAKAHKVVKQRM